MKTTLIINGKSTEVELTADNVRQIIKASQDVTERIKTFEDACAELGREPENVLPYEPDTADREEINTNAYVKLKTIIKVLNGDWEADWSNSDQYKGYPWLKSLGSGLGLSYSAFAYAGSTSCVGSRLVLRTSELAKYMGTQFIEIYNQYNN